MVAEPNGRELGAKGVERLAALHGDWTVLLNHEARIVYEVGVRENVFGGATPSSSIGRHILSFVCPDDMQLAFDKMEAALIAVGVEVHFQIRARSGGAPWRAVDVVAVNRFDDPHLNAMVLRVNRIP